MTREEIRKKWKAGENVGSYAYESTLEKAKPELEKTRQRLQEEEMNEPSNNMWDKVKARASQMIQQAGNFSSTVTRAGYKVGEDVSNVFSAMKKDAENKKETTNSLTDQEKLLIEKRTADYVKKEEMNEKTARQRATAEILQQKGTPVDSRPMEQRLLEKYDSFMGSETAKTIAETETAKKVSSFANGFNDVVSMGTLGGLVDSIGGILKYGTAEGAYQANLGEEKDATAIALDFISAVSALKGNPNATVANDMVNDLKDKTDNNKIKEILNDDQLAWNDKILKIVEDSAVKARDKLPVVKVINSLIQFAGKVNNNFDEAFLTANEGINKATDFIDAGIQKELEDASEGVKFFNQGFRSAVQSVTSGTIGTVTGMGMIPMYMSTAGNSSAQKVKADETDADWFAKYEATRASANREGLLEIAWEKASDAFEALGQARKVAGGAEVTKVDELTNSLVKYIGKKIDDQTTKKLVTTTLSETLGLGKEIAEEIGTDLSNFAFDKASDENATYTAEDLKNTVLATIVSFGTGNTITRLAGGTSESTKVYNDLTYEEAIEKIDNSDLDENRKNALKDVCQKINDSFQEIKLEKIDKAISMMSEGQKTAETTEKQGSTIENKPLLKQEQQTTLPEGKTAENEISQEIEENAENEQKTEENSNEYVEIVDGKAYNKDTTYYKNSKKYVDAENKIKEIENKIEKIKNVEKKTPTKNKREISDDEVAKFVVDEFGFEGDFNSIQESEKQMYRDMYSDVMNDDIDVDDNIDYKKIEKLEKELDKHRATIRKIQKQEFKKQFENKDVSLGKETSKQEFEGFETKTTIPHYDEMLLDNEDAKSKGYSYVKVVEMTPLEYLNACSKYAWETPVQDGIDFAEQDKISRYAEDMKKGDKFPMPVLDLKDHTQEGRHRALTAQKNGIKTIPVLIVSDSDVKGVKNEQERVYDGNNKNVEEKIQPTTIENSTGNTQTKKLDRLLLQNKEGNSGSGGTNLRNNAESFNIENSQDEGSILLPENTLPTKQNEPKLLKAEEVDEDIQAFAEETENLDKEQKERSYPSTVIESDFVTEKAKKTAQKVLKDKTYVPISNNESIEKATKTIESTGLDNVYGAFNMKFDNNEKMTLDDLVSAEILIQQYSYRGELDKAKDLIEKVAIVGTELGQMVQALSIIKKSNPLAQLQIAERIIDRLNKQQREKFGKKAKKIELSEDTIKAIKESTMENIEENISKAYAEVGQQLNLTWGEKLDNFRYLAMLGNPKTYLRNDIGNVGMHYLNNLKNQVSGGIQDVYKLFNENHEKTNTLKIANRDQRQFAKEDAELMKDSIDNQGNKYNDKAKNEITENKRLFDSKILDKIAKKNLEWLDTADNKALQWAYKDAMQDYMSANNLSSEDLRIQESDDEATIREKTRKLNKAREVAINQALEATFHQYSALANALNELERKGGFFGGVIKGTTPFKRTPINIAKTGVAYSPAGLIKSISYDVMQMKKTIEGVRLDYQEGKITEQQYNEKISKAINKEIDQFSKGLTGSALTAIGVAMAMTGWLKIKAGNEDDEDEFMESLGQQKYSITIGDYNISLDWLSPSAIPLFMGVEMYNSIKRAEEDEDVSILTALMNGTLNSLNPLFETTMLSNVLSTLASYSSDTSGKMGDVLATIALNLATQFIPSGITNVYKSLDGLKDGDRSIKTTTSTKKDTFEKAGDKFWNQVKYRLPVTETYELFKAGGEMVGLNLPEAEDTIFAKLPEKVDSYGQVQYRNDVATEFVNNLLNPATVNDVSDVNNKTTEELTRLNKAVDTNVLPATIDKTFSIDGTSHRMNNYEYAEAQKTYGSAYYDAVNTLMSDTSYKSIKDDEVKAELISDIKSYAREKAKAEYAKNAGIKYEPENEMYNTLTALEKAGGKEKDYFKYVVDTYNMESDSERLQYLNSHYNTKVRNAIYENDVGRYTYVSKGEDEKYKALKAIQKGDVSEGYTLYVQKSKEGAFKGEDGATGWKAGSKRNKLYDFLNDKSTGLTNIEKYYIATFEEQAKYLLNQSQRNKLRKYLKENKSQIGEETYNSMINKLNEAEK